MESDSLFFQIIHNVALKWNTTYVTFVSCSSIFLIFNLSIILPAFLSYQLIFVNSINLLSLLH